MATESSRNGRAFDLLWFLAWLGLSSCWILSTAATIGATFDEPNEIQRALDFWHRGSHYELLRVGTMPLPTDLAALPAFLYERWTGAELDLNRDCPIELLFWCRAMTLIFWAILLWFARLVGRSLGGPWAGRLAVAFLACEPSFLAHASLATKDIAIASMLLPMIYFFGEGRTAGWGRRIAIPGLFFALCLLTKASGMVFVPIGMFVVELLRLIRAGAFNTNRSFFARYWSPLTPFLIDAIQIGCIGLALTFLYCGSDWRTEPSWIAWAHTLPEGVFKDVMVYLSEHVAIFNNAGVALVKQIGHNLRGHGAYILGFTDPRAIWFYFPVVIAIKMTLPILLLPVLLLAVSRRSLVNWAVLMAAVLFAYSIQCRVQIGIRMMLPWLAIAIVGLSAAVVRAWEEAPSLFRRPVLAGYCVLGLAWNAFAAATVWPHGLCYVNDAWGGTRDGYRIVSEANYDWGQGIPELRRWMERPGAPPTSVWYFGTDPEVHAICHDAFPYLRMSRDEILAAVKGKHVAVGTTVAYGPYLPRDCAASQLLRERTPVDRTQVFLIYDFSDLDQHARRAPDRRGTE
jgi:hypothetical protein